MLACCAKLDKFLSLSEAAYLTNFLQHVSGSGNAAQLESIQLIWSLYRSLLALLIISGIAAPDHPIFYTCSVHETSLFHS